MKIGHIIPEHHVMAEIDNIHNILPVKYNGMIQSYVVCTLQDSTHMAIFPTGDGYRDIILISNQCSGRDNLVDLI